MSTQVISRNPFDLLGDDGETPRQVAAPKAAPAAAPKAVREVPGSKTPANNSNNNKTDSANRGGRAGYYNRGGPRNVLKGEGKTKPATDAEVTTVDPESGFEGERRAPGKNERGQARPRGHGEGSGRGRATRTRGRGQAPGAGYQGGERRNDGRRSAHALPDTEKRVASGWGAEDGAAELTAEVEGATDATKEAAEPQTPSGWEVSAEATPAAAEQEAEKKPEEEEDNTKSYEEYLAERQAAKDAKLGKLEGRQVDGTSEFVGSVFQKQEEEFFSGAKKEKAAAAKKEKERKEKVFLEVEGKFAPPSRGEPREGGRGGRGGRGGFRGDRGSDRAPRGGASRGGRGGARNNASSAPAVAVNDESAFPALGA